MPDERDTGASDLRHWFVHHGLFQKKYPAFLCHQEGQTGNREHLYQRILDQEAHVKELDYVSTLSGYIHWKLTGNRVIGIGDAAGMFPVNSDTHDYCEDMVQEF